jgi:type VI secretion system protein VasD
MNQGVTVRFSPRVAIVFASLLVSACGAWQSVSNGTANAYNAVFHETVKTLDIALSARSSVNSGADNRPHSVAVRIYQLKDRKAFDAASYEDLLQDDRTVLAADLQDMASVIVAPDGAVNVTQPMRADTQYIGVVAFFREANGATWRRTFPKKALSPDDPLRLQVVGNDLLAPGDVPKERPAP